MQLHVQAWDSRKSSAQGFGGKNCMGIKTVGNNEITQTDYVNRDETLKQNPMELNI